MLVSVIIPVYNRKDFIARCLESVLAQDFKGSYEIIVVDDGSSDGTKEILMKYAPQVRLHFHEVNKGVSRARNQGVLLGRGDIMAMTDSDCIVHPDWLQELIKPFSTDKDIVIVGGKVEDVPTKNYWQCVNKGLSTFVSQQSGYVRQVIGGNMALRREFVLNNPYDEKFKFAAGDDTEICWRAGSQGLKVYYTDKACITHHHRSSLKTSAIQHFLYGYISTYTTLKYRKFPYVNYGCLLILLILGFVILGVMGFSSGFFLSGIGLLLFSYLPFYHSTRPKAKGLWEVIWTYPGNYFLYISLCAGIFSYFFMPNLWLRKI